MWTIAKGSLYLDEASLGLTNPAPPGTPAEEIARLSGAAYEELAKISQTLNETVFASHIDRLERAVFNSNEDPAHSAGGIVGESDGIQLVAGLPFATGDIVWTYNDPPQGWLILAGQELARTDWPSLYLVFLDKFAYWGDPANSDRFRLPGPRHFRSWLPISAAQWAAATAYALGAIVYPTTQSEYIYFEAVGIAGTGTSAAVTEPTWPTTSGTDVVDNAGANQIIWRARPAPTPKVRT